MGNLTSLYIIPLTYFDKYQIETINNKIETGDENIKNVDEDDVLITERR